MFDIINIILLIIVVFIFLVLKSVLGKRTGNERVFESDLFKENFEDQNVIPLVDKQSESDDINSDMERYTNELKHICKYDKEFTFDHFQQGAKKAYEMVLVAFAEENIELLQGLLSDSISNEFIKSIDKRKNEKNKLEYSLIKINSLDIMKIITNGPAITIEVLISSKTESVITQNTNGDKIVKHQNIDSKEIWSYYRNLGSSNPNWLVTKIDKLN
tara:strand:+ start:27992 stop:28639 length:648 start_codon:yes stop_codon:yes gene_type:complete